MIRYISFDLDGTIVDFSFNIKVWYDGVAELLAQKNGIKFEDALSYISEEYEKMSDNRIEWYDLDYWLKFFGLNYNWKDLLYKYRKEVRIFPEARDVLKELSSVAPLILTSNAMREFIDIELEETGIREYFFNIFSATSDFKTVKNDPGFYLNILKQIKCMPHEIVHVGDHREFDYLIPSRIGINAYLLERRGIESGDHVVKNLNEFCNRVLRILNKGSGRKPHN